MITRSKIFSCVAAAVLCSSVSEVAAAGTLERDAIRKVIVEHITAIRHCYNEGLASDPELAGKLVTRFTISTSGAVSHAEIRASTLPAPAVEACIVGVLEGLVFPAPTGGSVEVDYPFELAPG